MIDGKHISKRPLMDKSPRPDFTSRDRGKKTGGFGETLRTVGIAVLLAILFRSFLFEPFSIPSGSMEPTLRVNDYLFVSKYSYGYSRYSFPFGVVPIPQRIFAGAPERGDVIVFRKPGQEGVDFIKRVVGLPGDRVQVRRGILHINNVPAARRAIAAPADSATPFRVDYYIETLPDGHAHLIQEISDTDIYDDTRAYTVPPGHYFFMGDNRDNSRDSRAEIGFVPAANLVGRAEIVFFSHNGTARFWQIWRWPQAIRFNRIGMSID